MLFSKLCTIDHLSAFPSMYQQVLLLTSNEISGMISKYSTYSVGLLLNFTPDNKLYAVQELCTACFQNFLFCLLAEQVTFLVDPAHSNKNRLSANAGERSDHPRDGEVKGMLSLIK